MKTIKDLKINDTVFYISGTEIKQTTIKSLVTENHAIETWHYNSKEKYFTDIKDETSFVDSYGDIVYLNQSEAIIDIKKKICDMIDCNINDINKEMEKLIELKNELAKYL